MEVGIVGLPNVGKSTLFNALCQGSAPASNYPYCTIEPNVAVVEVSDHRLDRIAEIVRPKVVTHPTLRFIDIAGLAKGASKGEGLGNLFLSHIRAVDAIAHVLRCFIDESVIHLEGDVDPVRDLEIVETELVLADLEVIDRRVSKLEKLCRVGDLHARKQLDFLLDLRSRLNGGIPVNIPETSDPEMITLLKEINLLSTKPALLVANIGDDASDQRTRTWIDACMEAASRRSTVCVPIPAKLEWELGELSKVNPQEALELRKDLGLTADALTRFVRACYDLLGVITFFTVKGDETRGWTIRGGTDIKEAAGKIHSEMREKFICAEVVGFEDFISAGGMSHAKEKGLVRTEGKDYIVKDGDIVLIKFGR